MSFSLYNILLIFGVKLRDQIQHVLQSNLRCNVIELVRKVVLIMTADSEGMKVDLGRLSRNL